MEAELVDDLQDGKTLSMFRENEPFALSMLF